MLYFAMSVYVSIELLCMYDNWQLSQATLRVKLPLQYYIDKLNEPLEGISSINICTDAIFTIQNFNIFCFFIHLFLCFIAKIAIYGISLEYTNIWNCYFLCVNWTIKIRDKNECKVSHLKKIFFCSLDKTSKWQNVCSEANHNEQKKKKKRIRYKWFLGIFNKHIQL